MFFVYIAIGGLVVWFVSTAGFTYTGSKITRQIKVRYLEAVLRQNMAVFDDIGTGQLVAQLGADLNVMQEALSQKLSLTISSVGTLIATYAISFALYWKLTFILTWSFFLSLVLLYLGNKIAVRYSGRSMEAQSSGSSIVEEALGSIRSTTALGLQKYITDSYDKYLDVGAKAGTTLKTLMGTMIAVTVGLGYLNVALAVWQGSRFLVEGETSFMAVVAIALITKSAAYCVLGVGQNAETFTTAVAAARRVYRMISRVSTIDSMSDHGITLDDVQGNVEFRNIKHIYPSRPGVVVAKNLSISFPKGKTTAIVGASGSGKSSITKLIMRFYEPVNGEIFLDDHNLKELNLKWLRRQIRLVNQEPFLFDTTILENIEYGFVGTQFENLPAEEKRKRVEQAAKVASAHDFISALPQGYQTTAGAKGSKLSGGQKQRIAIARALVAEPKILVLDEATSALDTKTEASVQAALNASSRSRTTILVAHRLSTVREADNIVVMKAGTVVEQGTHTELLKRRGPYSDLVGAQKTVEDDEDDEEDEEEEEEEEDSDELVVERVGTAKSDTKKEGLSNVKTKAESLVGAPSVHEKKSSYSLLSMAKFVMGLNAQEWHWILLGLFASVLAGFEEPVMAILYGKSVVAISRPLDLSKQIRSDADFWAWMFFLLAVLMMLVFAMQGWIFAYCSERLIHKARQLALGQMLRQEIAFFDDKDNSAGALVSFLSTEAADLAGISGATLGMILIAISTLISGFVVGVAFGWKLALVCSSVIPILIASGVLGVWAAGEFEKLNEKYTRASAAYAGEAISAIQTVASLTRESEVLKHYERTLTASSREGLKSNMKVSLVLALAQSGVTACTALGFWYGGTLFIKGEYTLLQFVVVNSSIISSAYSAGLVFSFTPNIGKAKRSVYGLIKLLERKSSIDPDSTEGSRPGKLKGKVDFRNVSFAYPTRLQHPALQNISISIPAGSSIALVGHTGCGKSTIVSLLERFYDPNSGAIFLDENPIAGMNITEYRRCIGLVNQEPTMLRGSIKMNLLDGNEDESIPDAAIEEACKQANIWDFIHSLP
jgi:ATP-binding cassette, subfamily B (MDR/TAP), member 1